MDICMDSPTCGQLNVFHAIAQEVSISAGARKLGMTAPSASHALKPVVAEFCRLYPQVQLEISVRDGTVNLVEQGFDLGIRFGNALEDGVVARELLPPFREGLYAAPGYLARHGTPAALADLQGHRLMGYRFVTSGRMYPLTLQEEGRERVTDMPLTLICNDIEVMSDAARAGLGLGRIFEPICALQPDRENFMPVLQTHWRSYPAVHLYYLQNSQKAGRTQTLIAFLPDRLGCGRLPQAGLLQGETA